jgi:hypothetical protein
LRNRISIRGVATTVVVGVAVLTGGVTVDTVDATLLAPTASDGPAPAADRPPQPAARSTRTLLPSAPTLRHGVTPGTAVGQVRALEKRVDRLAAKRRARAARAALQRASRAALRDPRSAARAMAAASYGWGAGEFGCLDSLWQKESGWNYRAANPSSGAYGIPQALPGSKMATKGSDWRTNPVTQIAWGLAYVNGSYGSPCSAWSHSQSNGWY